MISFLPCETFLPKVFLIFLSFLKAVFVGKKMVVNTCWASMNLNLISIRLISKHSVRVIWWTIELINTLPYWSTTERFLFESIFHEMCLKNLPWSSLGLVEWRGIWNLKKITYFIFEFSLSDFECLTISLPNCDQNVKIQQN